MLFTIILPISQPRNTWNCHTNTDIYTQIRLQILCVWELYVYRTRVNYCLNENIMHEEIIILNYQCWFPDIHEKNFHTNNMEILCWVLFIRIICRRKYIYCWKIQKKKIFIECMLKCKTRFSFQFMKNKNTLREAKIVRFLNCDLAV